MVETKHGAYNASTLILLDYTNGFCYLKVLHSLEFIASWTCGRVIIFFQIMHIMFTFFIFGVIDNVIHSSITGVMWFLILVAHFTCGIFVGYVHTYVILCFIL